MHGVTLGSDEKVAKMLATFRAQCVACAHERKRRAVSVEKPFCGVMRAIFVADSDAEAERMARPAYKRWFDALAWLWVERGSFPPISISADYDASKAVRELGLPQSSVQTAVEKAVRWFRDNGYVRN